MREQKKIGIDYRAKKIEKRFFFLFFSSVVSQLYAVPVAQNHAAHSSKGGDGKEEQLLSIFCGGVILIGPRHRTC